MISVLNGWVATFLWLRLIEVVVDGWCLAANLILNQVKASSGHKGVSHLKLPKLG